MRYQSRLNRKTLAVAISAVASLGAWEATQAQDDELEEITVTGSRIERDVGFTSPVPVTAITQDELALFEPGLGVSEQLENLPQYFGNVSSDNIAGRVTADVGQSQLNMRGMGGERTLVLLDGSRIVPSDRRSSVSVDYLPSTLIQRVDVVTGGASAAYGADALAGVTNFVLNRQYEGLGLSFRSGINEEGDGEYNRGSVTFGRDFGQSLHVFGTVEARINDTYRRNFADWDTNQGYVLNPEWTPDAPPGVPQRLTRHYVYDTEFSPTGLIRQNGFSLTYYQFTEDGQGVRPFEEAAFASFPREPGTQQTQAGQPGDYQYELFRRGHPQSLERVGVEQQTGLLGADFQLSDTTTLWGHVLYGRTKNTPEPTSSGAAGTGLGHGSLAFMTVYPENPFLPDEVSQAMIDEGVRSIRVDQHGMLDVPWGIQEHPVIVNRMWSVTGGFDTELGLGDWDLRGSYQYGEAQKHNTNYGWERLDRFYLAMDAVDDPDNPGTPICRIQLIQRQLAAQGRSLEAELHQWAQENTSVFPTDNLALDPAVPVPIDYPIAVDSIDGTISDCVPVNMFGKGLQSQEAIDYVHSSRNKTGISVQKQDFAELIATGTIHEGWGAGPISGALGATYRKESIDQRIVDTAIDRLGPIFNVTLPDGTVAVRGISFIMNGSATNLHRFSSQPTFRGGFDVREVFGETIVPIFANATGQNAEINLAARWADYSRAGEMVVWKGGLNLQLLPDLRFRTTYSHDIREGSFEELFVQQGRGTNVEDPWNNNESYTTFNLTGGNPSLEPEEADTKVFGFVYQPSWLEGLQLSADRYVVDLSSAIGTFDEQDIVDQCFNSGALCDRVKRDPITGRVTLVTTVFINIDQAKVSGWDFEASYRTEPDFFGDQFEALNFRLLAGIMDENSSTPLGGTKVDRAGSAGLPEETLTAMLGYTVGDFTFNLQQNYRGPTVRSISWVEGVDVDDNDVPSVNLTNLGMSWAGETNSGNTWRASLNINNLFDRDPIIRGNTRVGDDLGRRYSIGFEYDL